MAMATNILLLSLLISSSIGLSSSGGIVVIYWGQSDGESSLAETCATGNYAIVNVAFLPTFGNGSEPELDLSGHCNPQSGGCVGLSDDIRSCQARGIKVMLSIGGGDGNYSLRSSKDAKRVARYLWNSFLGGGGGGLNRSSNSSRPLGSAVFDGIDFDIELGEDRYWGELAMLLANRGRRGSGRKVYLSAAPQCPFPDAVMGSALGTGVFDYVWVQFYNNPPCHYDARGRNATSLLDAWWRWTSSVPATKFFLGLPAGPAAAGSGFMRASALVSEVLPVIKADKKYGGVMLWSRYDDQVSKYSSYIMRHV